MEILRAIIIVIGVPCISWLCVKQFKNVLSFKELTPEELKRMKNVSFTIDI